jgi:hypothetical protein
MPAAPCFFANYSDAFDFWPHHRPHLLKSQGDGHTDAKSRRKSSDIITANRLTPRRPRVLRKKRRRNFGSASGIYRFFLHFDENISPAFFLSSA